jgi:hypothetical protein
VRHSTFMLDDTVPEDEKMRLKVKAFRKEKDNK